MGRAFQELIDYIVTVSNPGRTPDKDVRRITKYLIDQKIYMLVLLVHRITQPPNLHLRKEYFSLWRHDFSIAQTSPKTPEDTSGESKYAPFFSSIQKPKKPENTDSEPEILPVAAE